MTTEFFAAACDRVLRAACRWRARHGLRRDHQQRAADARPAAGACQRAGAHRGGLHHRRVGGLAHLSPQRRLALRDAARHCRRARRDPRRVDPVEPRSRRGAPLGLPLSAGDGLLHPAEVVPHRAAAKRPGEMAAAGRLCRRISRRQRRRRLGSGGDDDAARLGPSRRARPWARSTPPSSSSRSRRPPPSLSSLAPRRCSICCRW